MPDHPVRTILFGRRARHVQKENGDAQEARMLDEAIRLGDHQADQIIFLSGRVRDLQRVMWHAVALLQQGRPDDARRVLEASSP